LYFFHKFLRPPFFLNLGYRAIATPSELHGFWTVFKKFGSGKVKWARLFEPSIKLAMNGFPVSSNLAMQLTDKEALIRAEPTMTLLNEVASSKSVGYEVL
ncbi:hypothetical protein COOONC_09050, partial [Cooperia oncophora]